MDLTIIIILSFKKQFTCLGENTKPLQFQYKKKLHESIKMGKNHKKYILHITIY